MTGPIDRLGRLLRTRRLVVDIDEGLERRLWAWCDRLNHENLRLGELDDNLDPRRDTHLLAALVACTERGVELDEREHGVRGLPWGDIVSLELDAEHERRGRPRSPEDAAQARLVFGWTEDSDPDWREQ